MVGDKELVHPTTPHPPPHPGASSSFDLPLPMTLPCYPPVYPRGAIFLTGLCPNWACRPPSFLYRTVGRFDSPHHNHLHPNTL